MALFGFFSLKFIQVNGGINSDDVWILEHFHD